MAKRKNIIDELAELRFHIKRLKGDEKTLAGRAIDKLGVGTHEGTKATGTVYESERNTTDWRSIAEKLKATDAMIRKHTKQTSSTIIRVTPKLAS